MTCDQFNSLLEQNVRLADDSAALAEARGHARDCPQCAARLDQTLQIERELSELPPIEADARLLGMVMSRIAPPSPTTRQDLSLAMSLGGAILLALAFLMRWVLAASATGVPRWLVRGLDVHPPVFVLGILGAAMVILATTSSAPAQKAAVAAENVDR